MSYCPIPAWEKARKKGLSPYEQVVIGKEVSNRLKQCNCEKKNAKRV